MFVVSIVVYLGRDENTRFGAGYFSFSYKFLKASLEMLLSWFLQLFHTDCCYIKSIEF